MSVAWILLPTFNGALYLENQIQSILQQDLPPNWDIRIATADDGSSDETPTLISKYQSLYPNIVEVLSFSGTKNGPRLMFENLGAHVSKLSPEIVFFCDQDDVWLPTKMSKAIREIANENTPAIYLGSARIVSHNLNEFGIIPSQNIVPNFDSLLLSNQRAGMTMAMNEQALEIWISNLPLNAVMHDWWVQLILLTKGAKVSIDSEPTVLYRQHESNTLGVNSSLLGKLKFFVKHGEKTFLLRSLQALEISKLTSIADHKKSALLVSRLIERNWDSYVALLQILRRKTFFCNRSGFEKNLAKVYLIASFFRYKFRKA